MLSKTHPSPHPKWHLNRFSHLYTVHGRVSLYFTLGSPSHQNCPFAWGSRPHLTHGSFGPPESTTQTASGSVQWFLHGSQLRQTDRLTDQPTQSATIGHIYECNTAMRPNNILTATIIITATNTRHNDHHTLNNKDFIVRMLYKDMY